tara:strand:- start:318 stop:1664 length:1347 start_codon:yes stop_codon:yes gene_type:complete
MFFSHYFFNYQDKIKVKTLVFLTIIHLVLGVLMAMDSNIAFAHVILMLSIGAYFVIKDYNVELVLLIFYLSAIELSWRMAGSNLIFWEGGKYYISFLLMLSLLKKIFQNRAFFVYPLIYILIQSLSILLLDSDKYRYIEGISFNLSGHICLALSLIYFYEIRLSDRQQILIHIAMIVPIFSTAAMGIHEIIFNYDNIIFATETNMILSGNFGGNQYGIMIGISSFLCISSVIYFSHFLDKKSIIFLIFSAIIMGSLSLATFSRTAFYLVSISIILPLLIRFQFAIKKLIIAFMIVSTLFLTLVPIFDEISGDVFSKRYSSTSGTGRVKIMLADLEIFSNNIFAGVGPGGAQNFRAFSYGHRMAAHNEFSRILAEHGAIGFLTFLSIYYIIFKKRIFFSKKLGSYFQSIILITTLYLFVNGFRFAFPAVFFGYLTSSFYTKILYNRLKL